MTFQRIPLIVLERNPERLNGFTRSISARKFLNKRLEFSPDVGCHTCLPEFVDLIF